MTDRERTPCANVKQFLKRAKHICNFFTTVLCMQYDGRHMFLSYTTQHIQTTTSTHNKLKIRKMCNYRNVICRFFQFQCNETKINFFSPLDLLAPLQSLRTGKHFKKRSLILGKTLRQFFKNYTFFLSFCSLCNYLSLA